MLDSFIIERKAAVLIAVTVSPSRWDDWLHTDWRGGGCTNTEYTQSGLLRRRSIAREHSITAFYELTITWTVMMFGWVLLMPMKRSDVKTCQATFSRQV